MQLYGPKRRSESRSFIVCLRPVVRTPSFCRRIPCATRSPKNWKRFRACVTDNFRVSRPKDFRVVA